MKAYQIFSSNYHLLHYRQQLQWPSFLSSSNFACFADCVLTHKNETSLAEKKTGLLYTVWA